MTTFKDVEGVDRFAKLLEIAKLDPKPHQMEGVTWMLEREKQEKVKGGINADEMGLGKTIMMIGTIVSNFKKRTLIVVPFALLEQWCSELFRITGHEPLVYHGVVKKDYDQVAVASAPIVLTTYGHIRYSQPLGTLHKIVWDRVVFDEAHHMHNMRSKAFRGAKCLRTSIRWLMTGTPIQNKKTDLFALLNMLGYEASDYHHEETLKNIIDKAVLKRTKREAGIVLPEKRDNTIQVEWGSKEERSLAQDVHSRLRFSGVAADGSRIHNAYGKHALVLLLRARQVCVMPELISGGVSRALKENREQEKSEPEPEHMDEKLSKREKRELMEIVDQIVKIHDAGISSKIKAVCEKLLKNKENGKKKLVFCQFRREIDQVETILQDYGFKTACVDGRTPDYLREEYLTSTEIDVLILQIQTGCEGLNLQTFSEVYFVTPHWNPAVEDQAVARCHRIGQKEEVEVFRFEMANFGEDTQNLENHARNIQETKRELYELFE